MMSVVLAGAGGCAAGLPVAAPSRDTPPRATGPGKAHEWRRMAWKDERGQIPADGLRRGLQQRRVNVDFWQVLFPLAISMSLFGAAIAYSLGRTLFAQQTAGVDEMVGLVGRCARFCHHPTP